MTIHRCVQSFVRGDSERKTLRTAMNGHARTCVYELAGHLQSFRIRMYTLICRKSRVAKVL